MEKEKRINFIDIARAIAIIYIVIGHTLVHSSHCHYIFKFLYSFHVVLFFILSGYTFTVKESFNRFVKNKFLRIMIPYFVWALLYLIPYFILGQNVGDTIGTTSSFNIVTQLKNVMYGNGNMSALKQNSSLWFLPTLFTMQIMYYFLITVIRKRPKLRCLMFVPILLLSFIFNQFINFVLPWGLNSTLVLGVFFYIGYILKDYDLLNKEKIMNMKVVLPLFVIGFLAFYFNSTVFCIDYKYGNLLLAMLSGLCLSLVTIYIAYTMNKNKVFEYIGKNTMAILIFHKLVVLIFQTKLGVISSLLRNSNFVIEFILCLAVTSISIIFSLICSIVIKRIMPILIGEKKVNKH